MPIETFDERYSSWAIAEAAVCEAAEALELNSEELSTLRLHAAERLRMLWAQPDEIAR
jgi:hypothetical protein